MIDVLGPEKRRRRTTQEKIAIVQQIVEHQQCAVDVARALDVDTILLRKWIRQYKSELQGETPTGAVLTPEQREIQLLRAQVKRLEMEKEILKQADALMSELPTKFVR